MKLDPKYLQLLSEALIPVLGFFLWDWSLYFILLFYFIDMIANEVVMHLKSKKICEFDSFEERTRWIKFGMLSLIALVTVIIVIHFAMIFMVEGIEFQKEIKAFWNYEEMGIKQGYVLIPLMFLVSYQQFKMEFLMPAKFRKIKLQPLWAAHIKALLVVLGFAGLCLGLSLLIGIPEVIIVVGIIAFTTLYKIKAAPISN